VKDRLRVFDRSLNFLLGLVAVTFLNASVSCFVYQEDNPEEYCLGYDSPRCKEVGDLSDPDGYVKPEYPYCINN
jgi:hypothetical protein